MNHLIKMCKFMCMIHPPLYDVVTQEIITGSNIEIARHYKIDPSSISVLRNPKPFNKKLAVEVLDRLILMSRFNEVCFSLYEERSEKTFICCSNSSIFHHFAVDNGSENEVKYIYELKKKRQKTWNFRGTILKLEYGPGEIPYQPKITGGKFFREFSSQLSKGHIRFYNSLRGRISRIIKNRLSDNIDLQLNNNVSLIGCRPSFFIAYLEAQFLPEMTWENYGSGRGKWNVDHIMPCNLFDLTDLEQQRKCFHYTNLRPLWSIDNVKRPWDGSDMFGYGLNI